MERLATTKEDEAIQKTARACESELNALLCEFMRNKQGYEMMPLWKYQCVSYPDDPKYFIILQAWNRRTALMLLQDTPASLGGIDSERLKRMKAWANSQVEKVVLST